MTWMRLSSARQGLHEIPERAAAAFPMNSPLKTVESIELKQYKVNSIGKFAFYTSINSAVI